MTLQQPQMIRNLLLAEQNEQKKMSKNLCCSLFYSSIKIHYKSTRQNSQFVDFKSYIR